MRKGFRFSTIYLICVFVILYAPIVYLAYYSFNSGGRCISSKSSPWNGTRRFSGRAVDRHPAQHRGHCLAIGGHLHHHRGGGCPGHSQRPTERSSQRLLTLNNVMIVSPDVIIGASFLILFAIIGLQLGSPRCSSPILPLVCHRGVDGSAETTGDEPHLDRCRL